MHPIDEHSPFYQKTLEDLEREQAELIITLSGLDSTYSQPIHTRHLYHYSDVLFGHRPVDLLTESKGERYIDFTQFHLTEPSPLT